METIKKSEFKEIISPFPKIKMVTMYKVLLIFPTILLLTGILISSPTDFIDGINMYNSYCVV